MNAGTTLTHAAMLRAAFSYFGIDVEQMLLGSSIESQGPAIVFNARIALTEDDVIGIVERMKQLRAGVAFAGDPLPGFPSWGIGAQREENSEGVAGRTVVHVDVPEEQGDAGLPASVWVTRDDLSEQQKMMASDTTSLSCLMQVALLTDEQKAKYGVVS